MGHIDGIGARLFLNRQHHCRFAVPPGARAEIFKAVLNLTQIAEQEHFAPVDRERGLGNLLGCFVGIDGAHDNHGFAGVDLATGEVQVFLLQAGRNLGWGDFVLGEQGRIEHDLDFALLAAQNADFGHAIDFLQLVFEFVAGKFGELRQCLSPSNRIKEHGGGIGIDAGNDRLIGIEGQFFAHKGDFFGDFVGGFFDAFFEFKLNNHGRDAVAGGRGDMFDPV